MPARESRIARAIQFAPWVDEVEDLCLYETLVQALVARESADRLGGDLRILAAGDVILESIRDGRVRAPLACRRATDAMRRYDEAYVKASLRKRRSTGRKRTTRPRPR